jgi:hypothetical protein
MKFIWVNGRTPSSQSACAVCSRPIRAAYLRHIETGLLFCDCDCYASAQSEDSGIGPITGPQARASLKSTLALLLG